jgi:single-stranded-DNA-specific exonuclease
LCKDLAPLGGLEWLAAVGTAADLGTEADISLLRDAVDMYGATAIKDTAALINAARRSASNDVTVAFEALIGADGPMDIASHAIPEATVLESYRQEVVSEVRRVLRVVPSISGQWALIKFRSSDLIHPLVAIAWTKRFKESIVLAANYGYVQGYVHFSVRSAKRIDLMEELCRMRAIKPDEEYAHGHARATGGILPVDEFKALLLAMGFPEEVADAEP